MQSNAVQKAKREKSPSELGEEVIRIMLEDYAQEERQKQAAADRTAQYSGGAAKTKAAGNKEAPLYRGAAPAPYTGNAADPSGGAASYSSPAAAKPAAGNQNATPHGGAAMARYSRPAAAAPAVQKREKTPSELGEELVARVLEEEGLMDPKDLEEYLASFEDLSAQTFTEGVGRRDIIGPEAYAARNAAPGESIYDMAQSFGYGNDSFYNRPNISHSGPVINIAGKAADAGSVFGTMQNPVEAAVSSPSFEEVMSAAAPDLAVAGINPDTMQAGFLLGDKVGQTIEDTHLAPGTSFKDYLWDKIKSGAWGGAEGAWNGLIDLSEAYAKGQLMEQNFEMQQNALFLGDRYREYVENNNALTREAWDALPEYAERFRSHKAAEYAQQIDELYDAGGFFKIGGDVASGIGQMAPTIAVNILTGGTGGMAYLYVSAAGNAAAEARAGGADDDTAFLYGMLSGSIEVLTEQLGGGIPGLNEGMLDDWLMGMAQSNTGRAALKHLVNTLGEGAEEFISAIADAYFAKMWNGDERDAWQTLGETLPDAFYEGLIGAMTSACMSIPGNIAEMRSAHTVDTAMNAMRNGKTFSAAQLADAELSMQKLTGPEGADSPWSRTPYREWKDTKSSYFDSFFPQMGDLTGNAADLSGIDPSKLIMLPMVDKPAEIQSRQFESSNQMPFMEEHWTKSQNSDILNNTENNAPDYENDIEIGRSVGAKAKNYDVMDLETGEIYHFAEGTKIQDSGVFAGKGTKNKLNIAPKYAHWHGGKVEDWQHAKGFAVLTTPDGDRSAEVHWMQCNGIGKFDFFIKEWLE